MRLLFITQKLHGQDRFTVLWVRAFIRQGYDVTVLCLEKADAAYEFPVISLGKESGASRLQSILRFERFIMTHRYDRVFIHMVPVWYALGFWWWLLKRIPVYLWYTHYQMQLGVRLFGFFGKRFFCATPQSLPQYDRNEKKVVVGHGIDLSVWPMKPNVAMDPHRLLVVHRLSRSKRLEIVLRALAILDPAYTLEVIGMEAEPDYAQAMKALTMELGLGNRVTFRGTLPMDQLPQIYASHILCINMASETIDKTMLESMTCGCYPVTTRANAAAIGIPAAPNADSPEALAEFVRQYAARAPLSGEQMYSVVQQRHSLDRLMSAMDRYVRFGQ
jgi:glycosyltransferase involved in cell wall biosynthesis